MEQSILKSTKQVLGVSDDDTSFDLAIMTHINSAFSTLTDLGVGPPMGFAISDDSSEWSDYLPDVEDGVKLTKVKSFIYLQSRLLFDPPTIGYLLDALKAQIQEVEWRLNVNREETEWVDPDPADVILVDGGDPTGP